MTVYISDSFLGFQRFQLDQQSMPMGGAFRAILSGEAHTIWSQGLPLKKAAEFLRSKLELVPDGSTVVAHGKAGLDLIECLIQYPETQAKVGRLICLQTPVWGTPVADFLTGQPLARLVMNGICKFRKLSIEAIEELTELNRQVYMILNRTKIQKLLNEIEIITVGSSFVWKQKPQNWKERVVLFFNQLIAKHSGPHDGVVPERSTRIANESHLQFSDVSHLGSVKMSEDQVELNEEIQTQLGAKLLGPSGYPHLSLLARPVGRNVEEPSRP